MFKATKDPKAYAANIAGGLFTSPDSVSGMPSPQLLAGKYLMHNICNGRVRLAEFRRRFGRGPEELFTGLFEEMKEKGLVEYAGGDVLMTDLGWRWMSTMQYSFCPEKLRGSLVKRIEK
ncbi:Uncharacterised protein [uncultured archaeon]|nr:Uncharacterised protein [uncultured archaeon]